MNNKKILIMNMFIFLLGIILLILELVDPSDKFYYKMIIYAFITIPSLIRIIKFKKCFERKETKYSKDNTII